MPEPHEVPQFSVSMGVDSGEIITGPAGGRHRKENIIAGALLKNAVDVSRTGGLRGKSAAGGVITLMTGAVYALTQKNYDAEPWDGGGEQPLFMLIKPVMSGVQDVYAGVHKGMYTGVHTSMYTGVYTGKGDLLCHH